MCQVLQIYPANPKITPLQITCQYQGMQHGNAIVFIPVRATAIKTYLSIAFLLLPALSSVKKISTP